jgi:hypothetical protein
VVIEAVPKAWDVSAWSSLLAFTAVASMKISRSNVARGTLEDGCNAAYDEVADFIFLEG